MAINFENFENSEQERTASMRVVTAKQDKFLTGPLELLLDMPIHLGCFKNVNSSKDPSSSTDGSPASCIRACLEEDTELRFAGEAGV